jgi:hypothetical protein
MRFEELDYDDIDLSLFPYTDCGEDDIEPIETIDFDYN